MPVLQSLWGKIRKPKFSRRHQRYNIDCDAELISTLRMVKIPGILKDVSKGGGMFRPALRYLVERDGEDAMLAIGGLKIAVKIVRTSPIGYSLQFDDALTDAQITAVVDVKTSLSTH